MKQPFRSRAIPFATRSPFRCSLHSTQVSCVREIYLEPESPFQAPAVHIPGPGGIKLGSPAPKSRPNHLIINTGGFQVNFTKAGIKTQRPAVHLSAVHLSAAHHLQLITCNSSPATQRLLLTHYLRDTVRDAEHHMSGGLCSEERLT